VARYADPTNREDTILNNTILKNVQPSRVCYRDRCLRNNQGRKPQCGPHSGPYQLLLFGLILSAIFALPVCAATADAAQGATAEGDGETAVELPHFVKLFNGHDLAGWVNVNTNADTWKVKDGILVCSGKPTGVMRSEKQYENFMLHVEWRHMTAGGNSGVFVWAQGFIAKGLRLPEGMEVQMLELDWINQHRQKNGEPNHIGYISGELFGANGLTATPDNPRGERSMSRELRCKGKGEWNTYDVVCIDGTIKLAINGKFVNSIRDSSIRKGYLCLESEGSEIHFRKIYIMELPPGIVTPEQTAKVIE